MSFIHLGEFILDAVNIPQILCKGILALFGRKEATVNTQLLIVHNKKKEQCDQRGHSQLSCGYSEPAPIIHSSNTQLGFGAGFISEDVELLVPLQ